MKAFPHEYVVTVVSAPQRDVCLSTDHLPIMESAAPPEFGGRADRWSPETLLVAALGDCFAITFQGIARASGLSWGFLRCEVTGTLDRQDRIPQFTSFQIRARLGVPDETTQDLANSLLVKAEQRCLIAHSLKAPVRLEATIEHLDQSQVA